MRLTLLLSFFVFGLLLNGQRIYKIKNGVSIKGEQYLENDYNIEFHTFFLDSVSIDFIQIFRKEYKANDFICKAIIQTTIKDRDIDELYFENIEPVGSSYGICFKENQISQEFIIGSKFGDYYGQIIIINKSGKIIAEAGGDFFIFSNRFVISDWASDLSGITIFDLKSNKIVYSKELPVYLSRWYEKSGKCYSAEWDNKETNNIYEFNPHNFSFVKTDLTLNKLHQFKKVNYIGCKPK